MTAMQLSWSALGTAAADTLVELEGRLVPAVEGCTARILVPDLACCAGCPPDPAQAVELLPGAPLPARAGRVRVARRWQVLPAERGAALRGLLTASAPRRSWGIPAAATARSSIPPATR
jgi:hypothetical protein